MDLQVLLGRSLEVLLRTKCHGDGGMYYLSPCLGLEPANKHSFYINLPIGAVSTALIVFILSNPKTARLVKASWLDKLLGMDLIGTFLVMAAVICYLIAMQYGGVAKPWSHRDVIGTLVGSGLLLIVFAINEWRQGERALLLGRVLKQRPIYIGAAFSFL